MPTARTIHRYGRRPAPFFVLYADTRRRAAAVARAGGPDAWVDEDTYYVFRDAPTSDEARRVAVELTRWSDDVRIYERTDVRDVTPEDEPLRGQLWAFEELPVTR